MNSVPPPPATIQQLNGNFIYLSAPWAPTKLWCIVALTVSQRGLMRLTGSGFVKWPQLKRWRGSLSSSHSIVTNTLFIIAERALKHGLLIAVSFDHVDMLKCIEWSLIYSSVWSIHSALINVISSTCVYQPFHVKTSALKKGLKQAWLMEVLPCSYQDPKDPLPTSWCQTPGDSWQDAIILLSDTTLNSPVVATVLLGWC